MKVGDYVRTKDGLISKYIGYKDGACNFDSKIYWCYEYYDNCIDKEDFIEWYEEKLVKSSPNIIDLIEVGDYVNGKLVEDIFDKTNYADKSIKLKGSGDYWYNEHIKSIVTKEQFESMKYKAGE